MSICVSTNLKEGELGLGGKVLVPKGPAIGAPIPSGSDRPQSQETTDHSDGAACLDKHRSPARSEGHEGAGEPEQDPRLGIDGVEMLKLRATFSADL
jgi:hypothetical protein